MNSSATDTMWMSVAIAVIVLAMVLMIVIVSLVVYIFKKQKVAGMKGSQTKSIQLEEWQWIRSTRVDVTLNAASANPYLTLGKNGRQVGWRQTRQTHEESPARFDEYLFCEEAVLGSRSGGEEVLGGRSCQGVCTTAGPVHTEPPQRILGSQSVGRYKVQGSHRPRDPSRRDLSSQEAGGVSGL
ncbi:butyrophilin subfamily 1 member A1-like isoform X3 [Polyodon spathula]|uniref:butyrophilin subfamily 1 member A1-like isoform X3 n=1 Tax=Polyodon spathula TaxID=7913 RepID=UPI001B7DF09B|nr:butyrophilin subfamily 1 member A1-like isoform X3 [Polyodon spathula]